MEDEDLDQDFIDEVNAGYLLSKYAPDFYDLLEQATGNSKVLAAMKQGKEISDKEQSEARLPGWLKNDRFAKPDVQTDKTKNKDIEPDK